MKYRYSPRGVLELQCDCGNWYQLPSPKRKCLSCELDPVDAVREARKAAAWKRYAENEKRLRRTRAK